MIKKIILIFFAIFFLFSCTNKENNDFTKINNIEKKSFAFEYPDLEKINFAWEKTPFDEEHFYNKARFDKEFLITSNKIYQFILYVKRYNLYIPYIEQELEKAWIPDDFKYLAIAESALKNKAISPSWAGWIWQFMPETAKRFWLIVNDEVDERYNFKKATSSAIKFLKLMHKKFWNWTLVAAAYNRGENGIARALEKQKVDNYYDLELNDETSRYVFRILSIKYLLKDYFSNSDKLIWWYFANPEIKIIKVEEVTNLIDFAKKHNTTYKVIKELNPWIISYKLSKIKNNTWKIKIMKN